MSRSVCTVRRHCPSGERGILFPGRWTGVARLRCKAGGPWKFDLKQQARYIDLLQQFPQWFPDPRPLLFRTAIEATPRHKVNWPLPAQPGHPGSRGRRTNSRNGSSCAWRRSRPSGNELCSCKRTGRRKTLRHHVHRIGIPTVRTVQLKMERQWSTPCAHHPRDHISRTKKSLRSRLLRILRRWKPWPTQKRRPPRRRTPRCTRCPSGCIWTRMSLSMDHSQRSTCELGGCTDSFRNICRCGCRQ
mmetsp:Transcript_71314/g.190075  ORF Transcript_71314/g.190075 Transcript_71314/m.190075 type:complete len:245 (-) Transcript_71314:799-1533(-)